MKNMSKRRQKTQIKFHIAKKHLLPRLLKKNGLKKSNVRISDKALRLIIGQYAREGGVRNLEKEIGKICRKVAYRVAMGRADIVKIDDVKSVEKLLGPPPYAPESTLGKGIPGVVTGLAWTEVGGELLQVEAVKVPGKGKVSATGKLGDVMKESIQAAEFFIKSRANTYGIDLVKAEKTNLEIIQRAQILIMIR